MSDSSDNYKEFEDSLKITENSDSAVNVYLVNLVVCFAAYQLCSAGVKEAGNVFEETLKQCDNLASTNDTKMKRNASKYYCKQGKII